MTTKRKAGPAPRYDDETRRQRSVESTYRSRLIDRAQCRWLAVNHPEIWAESRAAVEAEIMLTRGPMPGDE